MSGIDRMVWALGLDPNSGLGMIAGGLLVGMAAIGALVVAVAFLVATGLF